MNGMGLDAARLLIGLLGLCGIWNYAARCIIRRESNEIPEPIVDIDRILNGRLRLCRKNVADQKSRVRETDRGRRVLMENRPWSLADWPAQATWQNWKTLSNKKNLRAHMPAILRQGKIHSYNNCTTVRVSWMNGFGTVRFPGQRKITPSGTPIFRSCVSLTNRWIRN